MNSIDRRLLRLERKRSPARATPTELEIVARALREEFDKFGFKFRLGSAANDLAQAAITAHLRAIKRSR